MTDFLLIQPGDVVAVSMPDEEPFLGEILHVEGGARTGHPSYAQVIREDDLAIFTINPDWVTARCAPDQKGWQKK